MALIRQKSRPFTFQKTSSSADAQYFRREMERILDYIEQQFSLLTVSQDLDSGVVPTSRGGLGANFSQIPAFAIPYATQAGKFGWQTSSAFSLGLLGKQSLAEWKAALEVTGFPPLPENTLLGRYSASTGQVQVIQLGEGLVLDNDTLTVTATATAGGGNSYFPSGW